MTPLQQLYMCRRCADEAMGIVQVRAQALDAAQAHMLEVSEQVSVAELATELAEARASFMKRTAGSALKHTVTHVTQDIM